MRIFLKNGKRAAFTLVEIALALAIIGFALVAIIGVLPFGLNVQKENREETIVVQDANYFLDALRNGARGLDDLTNYVDSITVYSEDYTIGTATNSVASGTYVYTYTNSTVVGNVITNGERIIGLLSTPRLEFVFPANKTSAMPLGFRSNYVVAYVRALNGPAIEKSPQNNAIVRDLAFRYRLIPEITPFENWNFGWVDFNAPGLTTAEVLTRSNAWWITRQQQVNLHEIRLLFRWPIDSQGRAGNQRQVFRTLVGGRLEATNHFNLPIWLMQPASFTTLQ
jgi:type II secretory pathway pseudopilin PulG